MHREERRRHEHERRHGERRNRPTGLFIFRLREEKGEFFMADTMLVGETAIFGAVPTPPGSAASPLLSGVVTQWTTSDVTVATIPATNPDATGATIPVTAIAAGTFTLTATDTLTNATVIQGTDPITVSVPAPPTPTGLVISKVSG
jgi:hypothetical protein